MPQCIGETMSSRVPGAVLLVARESRIVHERPSSLHST